MENLIKEVLQKHTFTVNSFIDDNGHNHFMDAVKEIADIKLKRAGTYKHMDGSVACKKCNLTSDEGCKHN